MNPGTFIYMRSWKAEGYNDKNQAAQSLSFKAKKGNTIVALVVAHPPISQIGRNFDPREALQELGWVHESDIPKTTLVKIKKKRAKNAG